MPTLHIRNVPDEIYQQLRMLAQAKQRSLSAQVVTILERGLEIESRYQQQASLLENIRRRRFTPPVDAADSADWLREDRSR